MGNSLSLCSDGIGGEKEVNDGKFYEDLWNNYINETVNHVPQGVKPKRKRYNFRIFVNRPEIVFDAPIHSNNVTTLCFSPDQSKLLSAGNGEMYITSLEDYESYGFSDGHRNTVTGSSFSYDSCLVASCSYDNSVRIWNVEDRCKPVVLQCHDYWVYCVKFLNNDRTKVISGGVNKTLKIWDLERKKVATEILGCKGSVLCLDVLPDNQTVVCGESNPSHQLRIFDLRSRNKGVITNCIRSLDHHKSSVRSVHYNPNTLSPASSGAGRSIKIIDFRNFKIVQSYEDHKRSVYSICFHHSGQYLLSSSKDTSLKVTDLHRRKVIYTLDDHSKSVSSVQFSPDGRYFASGGYDHNVMIWEFPLGNYFYIENEKDEDEEERIEYLSLLAQSFLDSLYEGEEENSLFLKIEGGFSVSCFKAFF